MQEKLIKQRAKLIRQILKKRAIGIFIVTNNANVRYVTGFSGHDSWAVITNSCTYLITDSRYLEQSQQECLGCTIIQRPHSMTEQIAAFAKRLKSAGNIALEDTSPISALQDLKKREPR